METASIRIRILGIAASPRSGNSLFLLEEALAAARQVGPPDVVRAEAYSLRGKKFGPCLACGHCSRAAGECAVQDDFEELRNKWLEADGVIYSAPVYHMGIPGQLKCFIDRLGNSMFGYYAASLPRGAATLPKTMKAIGSIAQGIHAFSGQEHTLTDLINHALVMQSVPVAGDMWEAYIGAGAWTSNSDDREALRRQAQEGCFDAAAAVRAARSVGRRTAEMAMILKAGIGATAGLLAQDPLYGPVLAKVLRDAAGKSASG